MIVSLKIVMRGDIERVNSIMFPFSYFSPYSHYYDQRKIAHRNCVCTLIDFNANFLRDSYPTYRSSKSRRDSYKSFSFLSFPCAQDELMSNCCVSFFLRLLLLLSFNVIHTRSAEKPSKKMKGKVF